jgi:hypothetical protein
MSRCDDCGRSLHSFRDAHVETWAPPAGYGGLLPETPREALDWGWTRVVRCTPCGSNPVRTSDHYFSERRRHRRNSRKGT